MIVGMLMKHGGFIENGINDWLLKCGVMKIRYSGRRLRWYVKPDKVTEGISLLLRLPLA